jgi:addiction module HigA family antidote
MKDQVSESPSIPPHPGGFVRHEVLKRHGLSVTEAANALGVTRPALSALLNERSHLSTDMALRIEKVFGVSMETLIFMQTNHDIVQARLNSKTINVLPFNDQAKNEDSGFRGSI